MNNLILLLFSNTGVSDDGSIVDEPTSMVLLDDGPDGGYGW